MSTTKSCPYCKESIDKKATKCPHCQSNLGSGCAGLIKGFIIFILILFVIGIAAASMVNNDPETVSSPKSQNQEEEQHKIAWKFSEKKDDFDGKESKYCSITSEDGIRGVLLSEKPRLLVRQKGKKEMDILVIAEGVVFGHLGESDKVRLKFDDEAPFSVRYDGAADGSAGTIFLRSVPKIISKLKTSQKLVIELPVFQETGQRASFEIEGYSEVCKFE